MGEAKRRSDLDPTWGKPKSSEYEISQLVLITCLAIDCDFDLPKFEERLMSAGEWLEDTANLEKIGEFFDRMVDRRDEIN